MAHKGGGDIWAEARAGFATVRDLLRFAVSRFQEAGLAFGHGSLDAYDEAAYLILHALHLPLDRLEPFLDARLLPAEAGRVVDLLERRVTERIPAAYLTGEAWLGEFRFRVDERVIVPRSHIAELLRGRLSPWIADPETVHDALDLCTGSGCLAVIMAHAFPGARIDATDLSKEALAVAKLNVDDYGLAERIRLIHSDLFARLGRRRYDLIVSNPPYVDAGSMAALPDEYRHEPELALAAGIDGLDAARAILAHARGHLKPGGWLVMEIGSNREAIEAAFPELPFAWPETSGGSGHVLLIGESQLSAVSDPPR